MQYPGIGDGRDGVYSLGSSQTDTRAIGGITLAAAATAATIPAGLTINAGDCLFLTQSLGGNGYFDFVFVATYNSGTGAITFYKGPDNSYDSSGGNRAQFFHVPQYRTMATNGFTLTAQAWVGSSGGWYVALCQGYAAGNFNANGVGFRGGTGGDPATNGESPSGGGGGYGSTNGGGGGGGGNANTGGAGTGAQAGGGGPPVGNTALTLMQMGAGGGGGGKDGGNGGAAGGKGGGCVWIICGSCDSTLSFSFNGGNAPGAAGNEGRGGGGAAGCGKVQAITMTTHPSMGGVGGSGSTGSGNAGGAGSIGRCDVEACTLGSGDSNPSSNKIVGGLAWCSIQGAMI